MSSLTVQVAVFSCILCCCTLSVTVPSQNETAEFLWKLYHFALQSRATHSYPYPYKYPGYYQNHPYAQHPVSTYIPQHIEDPYRKSPKYSLIDILHSVARNDDLQCVPKLICEVTSGAISGRQQGLNLPVNVNMESLLGFLSSLNGVQASPLLYFGKAALLGLASKSNTAACNYAYPECPEQPDKVVKYLNNHNGGFFRFFNKDAVSSNTQVYQQVPPWTKRFAEQRIQTNVAGYTSADVKYQNGVTFPAEENVGLALGQYHTYRFGKTLKFPSNDAIPNYEFNQYTDLYSPSMDFKFPADNSYEHSVRKPKELYHNYFHPGTDFQKPLPNHQASPIIYPVRTGTGDLRLDPEELQDFKKPVYYQDDDVRVVFNEIKNNDIGYVNKGRDFSFPE